MQRLSASLRITLTACLFFAGATLVQAADIPLSFEAASVKRAVPEGPFSVGIRGGPGSSDPGRFTARNITLIALIVRAYDVPAYRIAGPQWLSDDRFEVAATVPSGATREQFLVMLRNLLSERFHLVAHKESRQASVYALTIAKGGLKLKEAAKSADSGENQYQLEFDGRRYHVQADRLTLPELATILDAQVKRTVIDTTGLSGQYKLALDFSPLPMTATADAEAQPATDAGPAIFTALQQQLGLKLEARKAPVEMLVVDSATRTPVEN